MQYLVVMDRRTDTFRLQIPFRPTCLHSVACRYKKSSCR